MPQNLRIHLALPSAAVVLLAGCLTVPQSVGEAAMFYRDYIGPVGTAGAALMCVSADGAIRITPDSSCADFSKPETGVALFTAPSTKDYRYLNNRVLGVMGDSPKSLTSTEIALAPDKPVVVSFTRTWTERGTAFTCQMHRAFVPEKGAHYQLLAEPAYGEGKCSMLVTRLTEASFMVPAVPAKLCGG